MTMQDISLFIIASLHVFYTFFLTYLMHALLGLYGLSIVQVGYEEGEVKRICIPVAHAD